MFEEYEHHRKKVWVRTELKGKHRTHCLCYSCARFDPNDVPEKKCRIANLVYAVCLAEDLTLPVWECPKFLLRRSSVSPDGS